MKKRTRIVLQLSPLLSIFIVLFAGGFIFTLLESFHLTGFSAGKFSLAAFRILFTDTHFAASLLYTFSIALLSSVSAVIFGTVLAAVIWRLPGSFQKWAVVYKIPLILPHITIAFITILFLGRTGILSRIGYHLGLIQTMTAFPNILYSGKGFGIITAYVLKETSFVILMVLGLLFKLSESQVQTARMLGASRFELFTTIVIPFTFPAIRVSFIIIFLYSLGGFDIPYIMSESSPEMLSVSIFSIYFKKDLIHRPEAAALLVILFLLSLLFLLLFIKKERHYEV